MKAFWNNMLFDLNEGNLTSEEFAEKVGNSFRSDLEEIECAIKDYDLKTAFQIISTMKEDY